MKITPKVKTKPKSYIRSLFDPICSRFLFGWLPLQLAVVLDLSHIEPKVMLNCYVIFCLPPVYGHNEVPLPVLRG